ncbi:class II fructose-bisphosphate aldolase [uncultured Anaerofustis sp.]|uniref:class II fructose-bisphosphate aldolase n=1 Tax=uncultured Anaerofustis sp. TaxID=904996 RepID=UPI0025DF6B80|nr:class II fructose-bisphosphate aldolase [uncultured Anaerofustis sp.]
MLVSMKEILEHANKNSYAVAAPNVVTELDTRAFIEAAEELNAPLILDFAYGMHPDIHFLGKICTMLAEQSSVPIAVNFDHGADKKYILEAIQSGFTSVMVDRSSLPFEDNVREVKEIVDIAHNIGISVEAELGHVGQANNYENDRNAALTSVEEAKEFVKRTDVDCLAVAIGTAHGAYPKGFKPEIDFKRLKEIKDALPDLPLVLHGSSGTDLDSLRKVCSMGINKVNIANDVCRGAVDGLKNADLEGSGAYDVYRAAREGAKKVLMEMIEVYGSVNKAFDVKPKGLCTGMTSMEEK